MKVIEQQRIVLLYSLIELGASASKQATLKHIQDNSYWRKNDNNDTARDNRPSEKNWRIDFAYSRKQLVTLGYLLNEARDEWKISERGKAYFEFLLKKVVNLPNADKCNFTEKFFNEVCKTYWYNEETEDFKFMQQLEETKVNWDKTIPPLSDEPILKPPASITSGGKKRYSRDLSVSQRALCLAQHKCELDPSHPSFIRRHASVNYMEPHHLIPMSQSDNFEYSLDREQNIFSLCSNCHNQIHYGTKQDVRLLIEKLFNLRSQEICKVIGREITLEEIFKMYKV